MRVVYVAGPYRAEHAWAVETNIRRAETAALELWRLGAAVICPHTNTRHFNGAAEDAIWLQGYLEILARCDALILIAGWEHSAGARAENEAARGLRMRVFQWPGEIRAVARWLET